MKTDILIVGSGLAGLLAAIRLHDAGAKVTLASKAKLSASNTAWAQGGLAAVAGPGAVSFDSSEKHLIDTLSSGAGLTNPNAAKSILAAAPNLVQILSELGVDFDKVPGGDFERAREGGHSEARVLHSKDTTGKAISEALLKEVLKRANATQSANPIVLLENCMVTNLIVIDGRVTKADVIHDSQVQSIQADSIILATGGAGQMFSRTTNPSVATADGLALAYRAGAALIDMEFMQFHPTALHLPGAPTFLISEAVRGAGATLLDRNGTAFAKQFHQDGDLATRDIVARAIHSVMSTQKLEHVSLDLRPIGKFKLLHEFPNIVRTCQNFGIDPLTQPIPVSPAAHYYMGGVWTDVNGTTNIRGLYAIGEAACTGLHGANRLASNSLLEAGVMALKVSALLRDNNIVSVNNSWQNTLISPAKQTTTSYATVRNVSRFKSDMSEHASLIRSEQSLRSLLNTLNEYAIPFDITNCDIQTICNSNLVLVASLLARTSLARKESRGAHFRKDYPSLSVDSRQIICGDINTWIPSQNELIPIDKLTALSA